MRGHPKYEAIEAFLLALPVRQENLWNVEFIVYQLCQLGDLLAKNAGKGTAPHNLRPASIATVEKELREFQRLTYDLAKKKIRKGGLARAREQLAKLVLHGPTIEALGNVEPCACRGIPDTHALTKLPARLRREDYPALDFPEELDVSAAELSVWSVVAADALYELTTKPPKDPIPDLPSWLVEDLGEKLSRVTRYDDGRFKNDETDHRPANQVVIAIAQCVARAVLLLTGRRPPAVANGAETAPHKAFVDLVRAIFAELNVLEADASYYAGKGARALPKGVKKGVLR